MGLSSDLESGGGGFDCRIAQVTIWVTCWSGRGHFSVNFGMSCDVSGNGLGMFSDGSGKVLEKNVRRGRKKQTEE